MQYSDSQVDMYARALREHLRYLKTWDVKARLAGCLNVSERASVFMDYLCSLGSSVFRWYPTTNGASLRRRGGVSNAMEGTYCFGGRIWEQVDGVKFKIALKDFCMRDLGMSAQEWIRGVDKYMLSVHEGSMLTPLEVSKSIVGFRNGVYDFTDMRNVVYHPFTDKMPVTELLDYDFVIGDTCPMWQSFLSSVLSGPQIALLQKFFSLGLVDRERMSTKVENTLWLVGPGGVGKSTILDTIAEVYGRSNISAASMGDLLSPNAVTRPLVIASVAGKVFNMCGEVQASSLSGVRADGFKSLCSGEPQPVRSIGKDYELRSDIPYMVFSMNRKPSLSRIDGAITRRILFVPFRTMVRDEDRDPQLGAKLLAERSGIRNWLMKGYQMLQADNFRFLAPVRSADVSDEWMEENGQTVALFLKKGEARPYAYTGEKETGKWWPLKVLYSHYVDFCGKWGYEAVTDMEMGRVMQNDLGFRKERKAAGMAYYVYGAQKIL